MNCPKCGKENSESANYCKNCGERLIISKNKNTDIKTVKPSLSDNNKKLAELKK